MKEQIIQLDPTDDIVSVRDKLGWIRAPRVLLVFPEGGRQKILQRRLDLVLLQREVTRRRAQLALITSDPVVKEQARELGIPCFKSIEASRKRFWRTARARLRRPSQDRAPRIDAEMVEAGTRLNPPDRQVSPKMRKAIAGVVFGVALALTLAVAYVAAPGARIVLTPAANQVAVTTTVTADPEAELPDAASGLIPARLVGVEVEASTTIETTGTTSLASEKARGIAVFTNLVPDQVTIPAGTIVRTSAAQPVRYITLEDATLPGQVNESVEIAIEALEPGFEGNVPSNRINQIEGPLSSGVGVTNPEPTRGGDSIEVTAISQDDYDRIRALLLQQLQQRAYASMQSTLLLDTEFIPIETLAVVIVHSETYSGYVDEVEDSLTLTMRVTVQGTAVDERRAREVVYAELAEKIGAGYQIRSGTLDFRRGEVTEIDEERRVTFIMQAAGDITTAIESAEVLNIVRGLSVHEAEQALDRELLLASPPQIATWPGFWPMMPVLPMRIDVQIEGQP